MSKWLDGDTPSPDDDSTPEADTNQVSKWFGAAPENKNDSNEPEPTASEPVPQEEPVSTPSYLSTPPQAATTDDADPADKTAPKRKKGKAKPASKRTPRPKRTEPLIPRWAKIAGISVLAIGIVGVAAKVGADNFGGTDDPVLAGVPAGEQMTEPSESAYTPRESAEPTSDGPGWTDRGDLPYESTPVVSGQCEPEGDEERIRPSTRSLRSAVADFYDEYRAHNPEGVDSVLDEDSSMKDQDWDAVFSQLDPDASWCIRMDTDHGTRVDIQVRMNVDGDDTVFEQTATGTQTDDGHYKILELEENE